ncbi:MAG: hypothetical protein IT463_14030 [Planctomycetes bacterium]|nr:hypothetical protein [Planctomycetota bacterium]
MLAAIHSIEELAGAISLMRAGQSALSLGLVFSIAMVLLAGVAAALRDERLAHAARRGQYALFLLTAFCSALLYVAIFDGYYFVSYVQHVTENNEVLSFKISACGPASRAACCSGALS